MCVQELREAREGTESPGTGVPGGCELSGGCWEPDPSSPSVLLIAEPSPAPDMGLLKHSISGSVGHFGGQ